MSNNVNVIFKTNEDAKLMLSHLREILKKYGTASLGDLHDLSGLPTVYLDQKIGWTKLDNIEIKEVESGFMLELPPTEEILNGN